MDRNLFLKVWEQLSNNRPIHLKLDDVFSDSPDVKGLTIDLIDNIKLTIWEDGSVSIADFDE
jgi:hypothetical protein